MREYRTIQSDTWDQIALKTYGSELSTQSLMAENGIRNPDLLAIWRFEYGQGLIIPELAISESQVATLPEYRRADD